MAGNVCGKKKQADRESYLKGQNVHQKYSEISFHVFLPAFQDYATMLYTQIWNICSSLFKDVRSAF